MAFNKPSPSFLHSACHSFERSSKMRQSFIAAVAFWQAVTGGVATAKPVHVEVRQVTASSSAPASVSISAGASVSPSGVPVTATLFEGENKAFVATPAAPATEPASGCVLATQTPTTITDVFTYNLVASTSYESDFITLSQGLYCTCAGGLMAGIGTSYNHEGTAYLYCETGGRPSTTGAVSTSDPKASAKPGDPLNPDVSLLSCVEASVRMYD